METNNWAVAVLIFSSALALASCTDGQPPDSPAWKRVHAGAAFSFDAPSGLKAMPVRLYDSFGGAYVADGLSLVFDYGHDANPLSEAPEWYRIDGRSSKYESDPAQDCELFPGDRTKGKYEAYVYVVRSRNLTLIPSWSLNMYMQTTALNVEGCARDERGLRDLQRVFRSIRFGPL